MKYIDNFNQKSSARIPLVYHYNAINSSRPTDVSVRKLSFFEKKKIQQISSGNDFWK